MYAQDSFFTLTLAGRSGLVALSLLMTLATLLLCWKLVRRQRITIRIAIAALLYFFWIWLAPQVYYTYYIFILDDLPWQVVVQFPPTPYQLFTLMLFRENANLSFHSQGLLGWLLLGIALCAPRIQPSCFRYSA